ncbi:hypothetical protein J4464_03260 [Candidatus Woesearchaeota archaeon]|nr:hypothetical protein [Candidatus Woesearchaeota archaeon]
MVDIRWPDETCTIIRNYDHGIERDDNPQNFVADVKRKAMFLRERLEASGEGIDISTAFYEYPESEGENHIWKIVYGPDKRVYERVKSGIWKWAGYSNHSNDIGYDAKRVIEKFGQSIRENPSINLDKLVINLVEEENRIRLNYNEEARDDRGNAFYDSTDSNHWREG